MAAPSQIVRHFERLLDDDQRGRRPPHPPHRYLVSDDPVSLLQEKGVATGLRKVKAETCRLVLEDCIRILTERSYTTNVERLSKAKSRFDIELPPRGYCWKLLQRILREWKDDPLSPWNAFRLPDVEPRLVEFSVLGTLPGSKTQDFHTDHGAGRGKLVSFGIPLIDVHDEHGPLECIPFHLPDDKYRRNPFRVRAERGSMFAWDGAMRHRGSANASASARPVLMFSLCFSASIPNGTDQSLHPELVDRIRGKPS